MTDPISFSPYLAWVDTTDPDNLPVDVRIIGSTDLLRYENFGVAATAGINSLITDVAGLGTDLGIVDGRVDDANTAITGLDGRLDDLEAAPSAAPAIYVRKLSDTSRTSNATLANDSELTFTLGSYELVEVTAVLFVTSPSLADFKVAFTGSGVSAGRMGTSNGEAVGSTPNGLSMYLPTSGTQQQFTLQGLIVAGVSGGPVTLQWSQYLSNAGSTTLHSYSYLKTRTISGG